MYLHLLSIQYFLELSRPALISHSLILPDRFHKYLPCLIKDFHKEVLRIQLQLFYRHLQNQRYTCILMHTHTLSVVTM